MIKIVRKQDQHSDAVKEDIRSVFGSEYLISTEREYENAHYLDGFIAFEDDEIVGILLFSVNNGECELVYLHSICQGRGIAKKLINRLITYVKDKSLVRLYVITTNDNMVALKLYQQTGFRIKSVYRDAMDYVRAKKTFNSRIW